MTLPTSTPSQSTQPLPRSSVKVLKQRIVGHHAHAPEEDYLAIEDPLEIVLDYENEAGQRRVRTLTLTMRTPGHDAEMITGFLFGEGIIQAASDIDSIEFNQPLDLEPPTRANFH